MKSLIKSRIKPQKRNHKFIFSSDSSKKQKIDNEEFLLNNVFVNILQNEKAIFIDGGFGTSIDAKGYDVSTNLWSSKLLVDELNIYGDKSMIENVHLDFLKAGADAIITNTYQASVPHLINFFPKLTNSSATEIIKSAIIHADNARNVFWKENKDINRIYPLIIGSVGCYGSFEGKEYSGDYGNITKQEIKDFHRPRISLLSESPMIDAIALETIPNLIETESLCELCLEDFVNETFYICATCRSESELSSGESFEKFLHLTKNVPNIVGIGVNCTHPKYVKSLILLAKEICPDNIIVCYPNSGEIYDSNSHKWLSDNFEVDWSRYPKDWYECGARIIGGCCRTFPQHIKMIRSSIINN